MPPSSFCDATAARVSSAPVCMPCPARHCGPAARSTARPADLPSRTTAARTRAASRFHTALQSPPPAMHGCGPVLQTSAARDCARHRGCRLQPADRRASAAAPGCGALRAVPHRSAAAMPAAATAKACSRSPSCSSTARIATRQSRACAASAAAWDGQFVAQTPCVPRQADTIVGVGLAALPSAHAIQRLHHATAILERIVQQRPELVQVEAAGDATDFGFVRIEREHRRIAGDAEMLSPALRALFISIEIQRHEELRLLDERRVRKHGGFELVAGRAPDRAPVEQHRFVLRLGRRERFFHAAVVPVDAGRLCGLLPAAQRRGAGGSGEGNAGGLAAAGDGQQKQQGQAGAGAFIAREYQLARRTKKRAANLAIRRP